MEVNLGEMDLSSEQVRSLFDKLPNMICVYNENKEIQFVNQACCDSLGRSRDELLGTNFMQLIPEADREQVKANINSLSAENPSVVREHRAVNSENDVMWQKWTDKVQCNDHGEIIRYISAGEDITERKRSEDMLRKTQEIANVGSWQLIHPRADQVEVEWSAEVYEIFGVDPGEFGGDCESVMEYVLPEDREKVDTTYTNSIEAGQDGAEIEHRIVRQDNGETRYVRERCQHIRNENGEVIMSKGIVRDITEQKERQEELEKLNQQLEARNRSLKQTRDQLESELARRKRAEEEMRTKEQAIEAAPNGIAIVGEGPEIIYANEALFEMFGYQDEKDVLGKSPLEFVPDSSEARVKKYISLVREQGTLRREIKGVKKGGEVFDILANVSVVEDQAGNTISLMASLEDITERKRMEKQLELTQFSVDNAPVGAFWITAEGEFEYVNDRVCEMLGYSRDELIGKSVSDIDTNYRPEERKHFWEQLKESGIQKLETEHQTKDGEIIPVQVINQYLEYKGKEYEFAFVQDISERKARKEKIEQQNQRLKNVIEGTDAGTWEWNVQTGEATINEKTAEMLGYTREELTPVTINTWRELTHPEDLKKCEEELDKHVQGELDRYEAEFRMKHKEGDWVWFLGRGKVISWTDGGDPLRMFGTYVDITERKRWEQKQTALNERLQAQNKTLKETRKELESSLEERELLLQEVHHRVKNNMQLIISMFNMQTRRVDSEQVREKLKESAQRVRSLALVHEKIYRSDKLANLELEDYVTELVQDLVRTYSKPEIDVEFSCEVDSELDFDVDKSIYVGLIINELVTNALKHGGEAAGDAPLEVRVEFESAADEYRLEVTDSGGGLPEDFSKKKSKNLGLHLVYTLAESQLDGRVEVESTETGTTFQVTIPREK